MKILKLLLAILGITIIYFLFFWEGVSALTSYDVENAPQMYLDASIVNTDTTLTLSSPKRNGSNHTFATTSGGVLRLRSGFKVEDIYYTTATVNATTNKVSVSGITRNLCPTAYLTYETCGNGFYFSRGAIVELNQDARLFNLKANLDRLSTMFGSGRITSNQTTQTWINATSVTTAERDAFTLVANGDIWYNETTGTMEYRGGGANIAFGSGASINATESVAGKVEVADTGSILNSTGVGTSGAENVLSARYTTASGGLSMSTQQIGHVAVTDKSGFLSGNVLGQGATATNFLRGDNKWAKPNSLNGLLLDLTASNVVTSTATETDFDLQYTIAANTVEAGDLYIIGFTGSGWTGSSDTAVIRGYVAGTALTNKNRGIDNPTSSAWHYSMSLLFTTVGASANVITCGNGSGSGSVIPTLWVCGTLPTLTLDTTAGILLKTSADWTSANSDDRVQATAVSVFKQKFDTFTP